MLFYLTKLRNDCLSTSVNPLFDKNMNQCYLEPMLIRIIIMTAFLVMIVCVSKLPIC